MKPACSDCYIMCSNPFDLRRLRYTLSPRSWTMLSTIFSIRMPGSLFTVSHAVGGGGVRFGDIPLVDDKEKADVVMDWLAWGGGGSALVVGFDDVMMGDGSRVGGMNRG